jgi:hypothetical protein
MPTFLTRGVPCPALGDERPPAKEVGTMGADSASVSKVASMVPIMAAVIGIIAPAYVLALTQHSVFVGFATAGVPG